MRSPAPSCAITCRIWHRTRASASRNAERSSWVRDPRPIATVTLRSARRRQWRADELGPERLGEAVEIGGIAHPALEQIDEAAEEALALQRRAEEEDEAAADGPGVAEGVRGPRGHHRDVARAGAETLVAHRQLVVALQDQEQLGLPVVDVE